GHGPTNRRRRRKRWPGVKNDLDPDRQRAEEPVPHHPAAGGVVEDAILALQIRVENELLEMLKQRATGAVHHALRQARRSRGVHDVSRMIEGKTLEAERSRVRLLPNRGRSDPLGAINRSLGAERVCYPNSSRRSPAVSF